MGLAIDNLLEADVVLADGSFVTASETENPDLFWALRGGGGNFGVVTSFLFQLHPIPNLYAGPMLWPLERSAEVLRWYREFITNAPDELNGFFAFLTVPAVAPFPEELWNQKMCGVVWAYTGETPEEVFAPIRAQFGPPALDWVGPISHPALNSMFDGLYPAGDQWYWKADFVKEIPDEAVDIHVQYAEQLPTGKSTMHLYPIDGVAGRVAEGRHCLELPGCQVGHGHGRGQSRSGRQRAHDRLDAIVLGGAAPLLGRWGLRQHDDGGGRRTGCAPPTASTTTGWPPIKGKYDPDNLFRVNQNIKPA